ncbi:hypothetical protein DFH08DRAFT_312913 [Mycena albidolilacea]|uniref:Uncharacterized protein n=1 Tax=Mycena albidolilacea TaxID=1033008 RepID=A0AAD7EKR0_9AGAR|nr:hypothetical protein DFH08DRAFT_312913 [Mycena albidolilacea]
MHTINHLPKFWLVTILREIPHYFSSSPFWWSVFSDRPIDTLVNRGPRDDAGMMISTDEVSYFPLIPIYELFVHPPFRLTFAHCPDFQFFFFFTFIPPVFNIIQPGKPCTPPRFSVLQRVQTFFTKIFPTGDPLLPSYKSVYCSCTALAGKIWSCLMAASEILHPVMEPRALSSSLTTPFRRYFDRYPIPQPGCAPGFGSLHYFTRLQIPQSTISIELNFPFDAIWQFKVRS